MLHPLLPFNEMTMYCRWRSSVLDILAVHGVVPPLGLNGPSRVGYLRHYSVRGREVCWFTERYLVALAQMKPSWSGTHRLNG
jgi:hypothetical protein